MSSRSVELSTVRQREPEGFFGLTFERWIMPTMNRLSGQRCDRCRRVSAQEPRVLSDVDRFETDALPELPVVAERVCRRPTVSPSAGRHTRMRHPRRRPGGSGSCRARRCRHRNRGVVRLGTGTRQGATQSLVIPVDDDVSARGLARDVAFLADGLGLFRGGRI